MDTGLAPPPKASISQPIQTLPSVFERFKMALIPTKTSNTDLMVVGSASISKKTPIRHNEISTPPTEALGVYSSFLAGAGQAQTDGDLLEGVSSFSCDGEGIVLVKTESGWQSPGITSYEVTKTTHG